MNSLTLFVTCFRACFLLGLFLDHEIGGDIVFSKRRLTFVELYGIPGDSTLYNLKFYVVRLNRRVDVVCISFSFVYLAIFPFYGPCGRIFNLTPQTLTEA
jgi:hypothetical protein